MIRDRKQRTDAKDDAPRSVSRRSSSSRDEDVVVVSAFRRFCLHHSVTKLKDKEWREVKEKRERKNGDLFFGVQRALFTIRV